MKSFIFSLVLLFSLPIFAQNELVFIPKSQLTEQQKQALQTQNVMNTVEQAGEITSKFKGFGKEVGTLMREGFSALSDGVNDFAKTDAGKYTAIIIGWKVMAKDIFEVVTFLTKIVIGILIFIVMISAIIWSYRRTCIPNKILKNEKKTFGENGKIVSNEKSYEIINDDSDCDSNNKRQALHGVLLIILLIAIPVIIFGCPVQL